MDDFRYMLLVLRKGTLFGGSKIKKTDAAALLKEKDEIITQVMAKGRDTNFLKFE